MRKFIVLFAALLVLTAGTAVAVQQFVQGGQLCFTDAGGNDCLVTFDYTRASDDDPVLRMLFTSSDTLGYTFDKDSLTYSTHGAHTPGEFTVPICTGVLATGSRDLMGFVATRAYTVLDIDAVWAVAESAGTVGIMPERLQGTEAIGSGDDLLTTAFDGTATANTVVNGTLTGTTANLNLAAGDRIGLDFTDDTPGELLNVCVSVRLRPN